MFKASIALVLLAFAALAYGWIAGNDAVLYGSIGASALAGLALVASQRSDHKAPATERKKDKAEKPARNDKSEPAAAKAADRGKGRRLPSDEITRQLDLSDDDDDLSSLPQPSVRPVSSPPARKRQVKIPEAAAWATEDDFADEAGGEPEYEAAQASYEAGFQEEDYPDEAPEATTSYKQGAAAADDFRSRLAAVLGQPGLPSEADFEPAPAPEPGPLKPARTRRAAAVAPVDERKPPARRGRRKAEPVTLPEDDLLEVPEAPAPSEEAEPEWIRLEDVPRIARATQPGGGFARPDPPAGPTPYRPKRPAVGKTAASAGDAAPAGRPRTTTAAKGTAAKGTAAKGTAAKAATPKTAPATPKAARPAVTRVSNAGDEAPKPRRGRPPKPKP